MTAHATMVLIPARMGATRLPGKPLVDIAGKPMILHVLEKAHEAGVGPVVVACGDEIIESVVREYGGQAVLTDPDLATGTDRIAAALEALDPEGHFRYIINLQGDLPAFPPQYLKTVVALLVETKTDIATLAAPIQSLEEEESSNVVKAVLSCTPSDSYGKALYFSRQPIRCAFNQLFHHIGVYGFQRAALETFIQLPQTHLEVYERLEQLRALEHGLQIHVGIVPEAPFGVDTLHDLKIVTERILALQADCL